MPSFPYSLPVELLEWIIKLSYIPAGGRTPPSPPPTSLLSVSKAVRLLALPYFFEIVSIRDKDDWGTFFDPSSGIFVVGEEGGRRWGWVKELVVPLLVPPFANRDYELGQHSYLVPLTIPNTKRIDFLRYLPIQNGLDDDVNQDEERSALVDAIAAGEDPWIVEYAVGTARRSWERDETVEGEEWQPNPADSPEVSVIHKQRWEVSRPAKIRRRQQYPTLESFLASDEGREYVEESLFEHVNIVLEKLTSDFLYYTLPAQLKPRNTFLPEKHDTLAALRSFNFLGHDPNPNLVFAPNGYPLTNVSTKLNIVRDRSIVPDSIFDVDLPDADEDDEPPLLRASGRFSLDGPVVSDGFPGEALWEIKDWLVSEVGEEELENWCWRGEDGEEHALVELEDEEEEEEEHL